MTDNRATDSGHIINIVHDRSGKPPALENAIKPLARPDGPRREQAWGLAGPNDVLAWLTDAGTWLLIAHFAAKFGGKAFMDKIGTDVATILTEKLKSRFSSKPAPNEEYPADFLDRICAAIKEDREEYTSIQFGFFLPRSDYNRNIGIPVDGDDKSVASAIARLAIMGAALEQAIKRYVDRQAILTAAKQSLDCLGVFDWHDDGSVDVLLRVEGDGLPKQTKISISREGFLTKIEELY